MVPAKADANLSVIASDTHYMGVNAAKIGGLVVQALIQRKQGR